MPLHIVKGERAGDEGKGKIIDVLANTDLFFPSDDQIKANLRPTGGKNAGHTVYDEQGNEYKFHLLPSTTLNPDIVSMIGNMAFVDPIAANGEITDAQTKGLDVSPRSLLFSELAIVTSPSHVLEDLLKESGDNKKGSTKSGISQTGASLMLHEDIRLGQVAAMSEKELKACALTGIERINRQVKLGLYGKGSKKFQLADRGMSELAGLWASSGRKLKPFTTNITDRLYDFLGAGDNVLVEGAQGHMLDVVYGKRPYTSSGLNTAPGLMYAAGVADFSYLKNVIGTFKLVDSKVGGGHHVTQETDGDKALRLRGQKGQPGAEYGTTTGRPREVGYPDLPQLRNAIRFGGTTALAGTKFDCAKDFGDTLKICPAYKMKGKRKLLSHAPIENSALMQCTPIYKEFPTWGDISDVRDYNKLPKETKDVVEFIEEQTDRPISILGVGPRRDQVIVR